MGIAVRGYGTPATVGAYQPYGYAASGHYHADSVGAVHVAKREAEAEADPYYLGGYGYGRGYGYSGLRGYSTLGYSGLSHGYSGLGYRSYGYSGLGCGRSYWG